MSWLNCKLPIDECGSHRWSCPDGTNTSTCEYTLWTCKVNDTCDQVTNPDISGYGVLVSFFVTAILTFVCAWAMLLLEATYRGDDHKSLSLLDRRFIWAVGWWKKTDDFGTNKTDSKLVKWRLVLQKVLLTLSDANLLTGLGILIAGFSQVCTITIYHYHAVVYLAWMASSVHMVTLTISRFYLRNNKPVLIVRLVFMSALFFLLILALCLTGSSKWPTAHGAEFTFDAEAVCTWQDGNLSKWRGDTIVALVFVSLGFFCRLFKVFAYTSDTCRHWLRIVPENGLKRLFNRLDDARAASKTTFGRGFFYLSSWFTIVFYLYIRALYDIYESLLVELVWMTLSLLWGFAQIFSWHKISPLNHYEKVWNFGQILPLLLVAAPLFALPEFYTDSRKEAPQQSKVDAKIAEVIQLQTQIQASNIRSLTNDSLKVRRSFWTETAIHSTRDNDVKTRVPFLDRSNEPYRSVWYNLLVALLFATGLTVFAIIIHPKFTTNAHFVDRGMNTFDTWTRFFRSKEMWLEIWMPILLGPGVLWFFFMAPLSAMIRRGLNAKRLSYLGHQRIV